MGIGRQHDAMAPARPQREGGGVAHAEMIWRTGGGEGREGGGEGERGWRGVHGGCRGAMYRDRGRRRESGEVRVCGGKGGERVCVRVCVEWGALGIACRPGGPVLGRAPNASITVHSKAPQF